MAPHLGPGSRIQGYRLVALLGRGGMGAVWRAEDEKTGAAVALKTLLPLEPGPRAERTLQRFLRESKLAAEVQHENVVRVHLAGEHEGVPFLVCDLVPGGSLDDALEKRGRLPWREAARLGAQVARGLEAIHARGLVHRDLKPANVLLDARGVARVADFGLARREEGNSVDLTRSGDVVGTYAFLSPEQASGNGHVDHRADLYSLGGTLFALLTGEAPFSAPSALFLLAKHASEAPRSPRQLAPDVPEAFATLVLRLLAKAPSARPGADEVAAVLDRLAGSKDGSDVVLGKQAGQGSTAARLALVLGGAVLLAGAGLAARSAWPRPGPATPGDNPAPPGRPRSPSPTPRAARPTPTPPGDAGTAAREALPEGGHALFHVTSGSWRLKRVLGRPELRTGLTPGAIAFVQHGKQLALGGSSLKLVDLESGHELRSRARSWIEHADVLANDLLATVGAERLVWDLGKDAVVQELPRVPGAPGGQRVSVSGDRTRFALYAPDLPIDIREASTGTRVYGVEAFGKDEVAAAAVSATGRDLVFGGADGQLRRAGVGGEPSALGPPGDSPITAIACSAAGNRLLVGHADGTVALRDAGTGRVLATRKRSAPVTQVAFAPSGTRAASLGTAVNPSSYKPPLDPHVWLYDLAGEALAERPLETGNADPTGVAFSLDDRLVATTSWDFTVRVHDAASGQLLHGARGPTGWTEAVAVSPDGKTVATGSWDGTVRLWDAATGEERRAFRPFARFVADVAFAPRGDRLVACDQEGTVKVLEPSRDDAVELRELLALPAGQKRACFTPDGKHLVVACASGSLLLIEIAGHTPPLELGSPRGAEAGYTSCAFVSDNRLVAGLGDGRVELLAPYGGAPVGYVLNVYVVRSSVPKALASTAVKAVVAEVGTERCAALLMGGGVVFFDATADVTDAAAFGNGATSPTRRASEAIQGGWMRGVAISPDPRAHLAVTTSDDRSVRAWDTRTGALVAGLELAPDADMAPLGVAFLPGGRSLVLGTTAGIALELELGDR